MMQGSSSLDPKRGEHRMDVFVLTAIALLSFSGAEADTARFGVASTGREAGAKISKEASRAPYILIFDHEGGLIEVFENRGLPTRRAGPHIARILKDRKVTHYIAEQFGRNLARALDGAEIERVEKTGAADEAVKQVIEGRCAERSGP
ncbi:MAG: NifB/NifX family molybdenum-iron cluster-binding protein [bacterium]